MCLYSLGIPSYQLTYPPVNYPSTSPYAGLTHHFKKLVKEGLLCRFIVKALLYPQFIQKADTSMVVLRKRRKNSVSIIRTNSDESEELKDRNQSHRHGTGEDDLENITDDDEDDACSSCASSSFGFVHFKTGKKSNTESTDYETFIDYGPDDCQKSTVIKSSVIIDRDSDGSFIFSNSEFLTYDPQQPRDSLPIYSKPLKTALAKLPSRDSVTHTSSARLKIGLKPQHSETSEISDFEKRIDGSHMACEDLVNLEDSTQIKFPLEKRPTLDERHSMPTLFVGNRFNSSTTTEVYIPSYSDKKHVKQLIENSNNDQRDSKGSRESRGSAESLSTTTHSSSIDLPAIVPASDQLTAELLYNFDIQSNFQKEKYFFFTNFIVTLTR